MLSLRFDVFALLTPKENTDLKNRGKFWSVCSRLKARASVPDAQETELGGEFMPLAVYAWNQRWHALDSYSLSTFGRFLRIRLTFCNDQIADQVTMLVACRLQDEQKASYQEFLDHSANEFYAAPCLVPRAVQFATKCIKTARQDAETRRDAYPESRQL